MGSSRTKAKVKVKAKAKTKTKAKTKAKAKAKAMAIVGPRSTAVLLDRYHVLLASIVVFWLLGFLYKHVLYCHQQRQHVLYQDHCQHHVR